MPKLNKKATAYIDALPSPQKEICQALREIILENFPQMKEEFKWNYPAYHYDGKRICITGGFKEHTNIELFYGAQNPPHEFDIDLQTHIRVRHNHNLQTIPFVGNGQYE